MDGATRLCSRCDKPLNRYTPGGVCGPCVTAARDTPHLVPEIRLPLEFWFSDRISSALAQWDWTTVLVGVHQHTGATQSAIAQQTGLSQGSISRLMAGRSGGQAIETALKIIDGLGAPRVLAGLTPQGLGHITGRDAKQERQATGTRPPVRRREFTTRLVLAGLSIPLLGENRSPAGVDIANSLERPGDAVADLWALDARHGGAALADLAEARLASILRQMRQITVKPSEELFLHAVVGQVASAAAWFSYERGDLDRAERLLKDGLYAAHCADDMDVRLQILDTVAMVSSAKGQPAKSVAAAQGALDSCPQADPQLRALLSMRASIAYARLQEERAHERSHANAWDLLGKANASSEPDEWFRFFGEDEIRGLTALAQVHLGHHARTVELLEGITAGMAPRNRAFYRVCQATALARSGDCQSSIDVFRDNLPLLTEMTSARISKKIKHYAAALTEHPGDDAAETRRIALSLIGGDPHS